MLASMKSLYEIEHLCNQSLSRSRQRREAGEFGLLHGLTIWDYLGAAFAAVGVIVFLLCLKILLG